MTIKKLEQAIKGLPAEGEVVVWIKDGEEVTSATLQLTEFSANKPEDSLHFDLIEVGV